MKESLTNELITSILAGPKRIIIYDLMLPSLALYVTPKFTGTDGVVRGGHKSFYYIYHNNTGIRKQLHIGSFPELSPHQAREIINNQLQVQVNNGIEPIIKSEDKPKTVLTINHLLDMFFDEYVAIFLKDNTYKLYVSLRKNYVSPEIGNKPINLITRDEIQALHYSLRSKPTTANRVLALCSKFFGWCENKSYLPRGAGVTKGIIRYHENMINKFFSQSQMTLLWNTICDLEETKLINKLPSAALKLLILTGARKNEILSLKWSDIDFENNKATLEESKTGFKTLFFPDQAMDVLRKLGNGGVYVFPSRSSSGHLADLQWQWRTVLKTAKLEGRWRIHDLRHGFASSAVNNGGSLPFIGFLLGHKRAKTTERYAHVAENPAQALLDLVAKKIVR